MSDISDKKELLIGSGYRRFRIMANSNMFHLNQLNK